MSIDFRDALSVKIADVERPPMLPAGVYVAAVKSAPTFDQVGLNGRYNTVDFILDIQSVHEDSVNEDDLREYGDLNKAATRHRFMIDSEDEGAQKRGLFNLRRFLEEHLQIDNVEGMSLNEALAASPQHQCLVTMTWEPDRNDPTKLYERVKSTAPVV